MQVATLDLSGAPGPVAELLRDASAQLWLDGEQVLAVSVWGSRVGLTLTRRIILIDADDYWRLLRAALNPTAAPKLPLA